ncbi:Do family serine endopeptidase [Rhodoblastus acidophilus]|uniref:Probable periplasmic serine endoprotease DegP-like n=1 Tax=Candidatus Rhodoblastus alkanivorans TaxID=2954117 RepID=A0ABS9Z3B4_9HYPH|nr:Do family serine endopeptidase [Candidatus Rhodoblastus alkanivorans]MCI4678776.1 Do family serine endopeptidase [Candidatus Rhodoblastus alkanivorans]MCI4682165.1 Do family serine endopeptidase [Candidatus Rhodoblastus alkanivorans]MDI4639467.1 Do family serine endopeptidase [Rhodoblastus acidophilus]
MLNWSAQSSRREPSPSRARRRPLRRVMLSAVGATALIGSAAGVTMVPAHAEAPANQGLNPVGPTSFADLVDRVKGAVVSVKVDVVEKSDANGADFGGGLPPGMPPVSPDDPLYHFFKRFGSPMPRHPHKGEALGSGFIISSDGYVVTNNHVVNDATDVKITLQGGKVVPAKIVGVDKKTDLALLKITAPGTYPYVQFSNTMPRVGDWVIAVGNPFGLGGTVTAGIVSARGRDIGSGPYDDYLQIDAPVNRGNSGGPTFNEKGEVVGINTAIYSPSGGSVGIGFAIPSEVAKEVITELKEKGSVSRGYIGVQIQSVTTEIAESLGLKSTEGALVAQVQPNTPAVAAGVESGDVISAVNGVKVENPHELSRKIAALGPNAEVDLTIIRNGADKNIKLKLGKLPDEVQAKAGTVVPEKAAKTALAKFGFSLEPSSDVAGAGKVGAVVTDIDPDGPAAQKGLRQGDVILDIAGKPVVGPADVVKALSDAKKDGRRAVLLRVKTGDNTHFLALSTDAS